MTSGRSIEFKLYGLTSELNVMGRLKETVGRGRVEVYGLTVRLPGRYCKVFEEV